MTRCVRCHSLLALTDVAVVPPRASALRWGSRWRRRRNRLLEAIRSLRAACALRLPTGAALVNWDAVAWSIIPGLGHIKYADRRFGQLLLVAWLALLAAALLSIGLTAFPWWIASAAVLHGVAIHWWLTPVLAIHGPFGRALRGALLFLGLGLGVYRPLIGLAEQFYVPFPVNGLTPGPVIQDGDGLLCEGPWMRPAHFQRGDLVLYRLGGADEWGAGHGYVIQRGFGLDRIVGLPGDRVQVRDDGLRVNGESVNGRDAPLGEVSRLRGFEVLAGPGEYVILPSRLKLMLHGQVPAGAILAQLSRVRDPDVLGRAVVRLRPWSRFGNID